VIADSWALLQGSLGVLYGPALDLDARDESLTASTNELEIRSDVLVKEVRAASDRSGSLGGRERESRERSFESLRHLRGLL
jgi:hypothetical protein